MPEQRVCGECAAWEAKFRISYLGFWVGHCILTPERRKSLVPVIRSERAPACDEHFRERESDGE